MSLDRVKGESISQINLIFSVVVVFTVATSVFSWFVFSSFDEFSELQKKNERIAQLQGTILQYDEVLTMSAKMAAATGEMKWELRYRQIEPLLDEAIRELIILQPNMVRGALATEAANANLVEMENHAFNLVETGKSKKALEILSSPEYEKQKGIYSEGLWQLNKDVNETLKSQNKKNQARVLLLRSTLFLLILMTFFGWIFIFLNTRRMNNDLVTLNETLDLRVKDRTVKLLNASKMASLGEMAGGMAHEINNPIGIIQGKANLLIKHINMAPLTQEMGLEHLKNIVSMSERIVRIIKGLRSFSRNADRDAFVDIPVGTLISNVLSLCSERFSQHEVKLTVTEIPNISIECRGTQLEQVVLNILNNAHDAVMKLTEKWVRIEVKDLGDTVRICIIDSGKGIPPEILDNLMQPFFTTKDVGRGTGLGLSLSKGIIEDHHGKLWYDSASINTQFVIELPKRQAQIKAE